MKSNRQSYRSSLGAIAVLILSAATASAQVKMPALFGDHMVLQRSAPIPVWGTCSAGTTVTVTFKSASASAKADADGHWIVRLEAQQASADAGTLTIVADKQTIAFKDVLVGDVWVCSGQSNMGVQLQNASNATEALADANRPTLRLFQVAKQTAPAPLADCTGKWELSSAASAKGFTAVGYLFGKEIADTQKIPVGLIESALGATPAQSWTSIEALSADPELNRTYLEAAAPLFRDPAAAKATHDAWMANGGAEYIKARQNWYIDRLRAQKEGKPAPAAPKPASPEPLYFDAAGQCPTVLYNGMICPLAPYGIKGAIWYQGESNANNSHLYAKLLTGMIGAWRGRWQQGDFPFLIVQLPDYGKQKDTPGNAGGWTGVREGEALVARTVANAAMAVTIDVGDPDDLHPPFKAPVGHRLALVAREKVYGEKILGSSPIYESHQIDGDKIRIKFSNVGSGLKIGVPPAGSKTAALPTSELKGFAIAGSDGKFVWAKAKIEGADTVVVSADGIAQPAAVHYAFGSSPEANLYNSVDLPASPFRAGVEPEKAKRTTVKK